MDSHKQVAWHTRRYGFSTVHRANPSSGVPACGLLPPAGAILYHEIPPTLGNCRLCYRDRKYVRPEPVQGTSKEQKISMRELIAEELPRFLENGGTIQQMESLEIKDQFNRVGTTKPEHNGESYRIEAE